MKKSMIVAGAASAVLAAMPVIGAFAATSNSFMDTLTVTVPDGCTLEDATEGATAGTYVDPGTYIDRTFTGSIPAGTAQELTLSTPATDRDFRIACNVGSGTWTVTAVASNGGYLNGISGNASTNSATIAPGATFSGSTSGWAIQSNASAAATANPYASYAAYTINTDTNNDSTNDATTFLQGSATGTVVTFNPSYKVYVAPNQATGNYQGTVTYTVALDAPAP